MGAGAVWFESVRCDNRGESEAVYLLDEETWCKATSLLL